MFEGRLSEFLTAVGGSVGSFRSGVGGGQVVKAKASRPLAVDRQFHRANL